MTGVGVVFLVVGIVMAVAVLMTSRMAPLSMAPEANQVEHADGRVELVDTSRIETSPLYNHDLAPVPVARRNWTTYNYAALWISMAHCIPTYMLASGLMAAGHELVAGAHHDPARQHDRAGPDPAQLAPGHEVRHPVPGLRARRLRHDRLQPARPDARAGGLRLVRHPGLDRRRGAATRSSRRSSPAGRRCCGAGFGGHTTTEWLSFLLFWGLNIFIIYRGMDLLREVENWAAPFVLVMTAVLLWWAIDRANGLGPLLSAAGQAPHASREFLPVFIPSLTAMIGFWATLSLNMPDFTRFGRSQREQMRGPGGRAAHDHVRVRGHGRADHQRDRHHLRRGDLGSRSSSSSRFQRAGGGGHLDVHGGGGHAGRQHRRQRRLAGQRLRQRLPARASTSRPAG